MAPAPESFVLAPCTVDDVEGMVQVYLSSFFGSGEPLVYLVLPRDQIGEQEMTRWLRRRFTGYFSKREIHVFKITHVETGKLVAFARWAYPHVLTEEEQREKAAAREKEEKEKAEGRNSNWPVGANLELVDAKFGTLGKLLDKYVRPDDMYGE